MSALRFLEGNPSIRDIRATTRIRYLNPSVMDAYLSSRPSLKERLIAAYKAVETAENPQGRFDLKDEETSFCVPVCRKHLQAAQSETAPIQARLRALRAQHFAWDECWSLLSDEFGAEHGFGPGDARILGVR